MTMKGPLAMPHANYVYEKSTVKNLSTVERIASGAAGAILLFSAFKLLSRHNVLKKTTFVTAGYLLYRGLSGNCIVKAGVNDRQSPHVSAINIRTAYIIDRPRNEVYTAWRDLASLPMFMRHLKMVKVLDEKHSVWQIKLINNQGIDSLIDNTIEWNAEIVEDKPNEMLSWRSLPGSNMENAGKIVFKETVSGKTEIDITFSYRPPAGLIGKQIATLFQPIFRKIVKEDLQGFKRYMEIQNAYSLQ